MSVPLSDEGRAIGETMVRIGVDDAVALNREALLQAAGAGFSPSTRSRIEALRATDGFIPVTDLISAGIDAKFDPATQEVSIRVAPDDRAIGDIDLGQRPKLQASAQAQAPAAVAGYLNIIAGVDYAWDGLGSEANAHSSQAGGHLELESAVRAWDTVLENRVIYDGDVDTSFCPAGAICNFDHDAGVKRQMTRLIHDLPEENIRVSAGDVDVMGVGLQRRADISGIAIEKAPRKLSPLSSNAPLGSGSLRLERPSDVEIRVNGALLQTLHLRPGVYNWHDLALTSGANDVELTIIDDLGTRTRQRARTFYDDSLLATGSSEWGIVGGVPAYYFDDERRYDAGYAATGFLRYGVSDALTVLAHIQADENVAMAGAGFATRTPWGIVSVETAASSGDLGTGFAADVNWDLLNVGGWLATTGENLRLHTEYRSAGFHTPGEHLVDLNGIIFPEYNYWLRLDASYSVPIQDGITASLSARYQFADPDRISYSQYAVNEDRFGADLTLSRAITASSSGSLTLGYSNESYLRDRNLEQQNNDGEFRFALHYYWRPDEQTSVAVGYDSLNRQSDLSANRQGGEPNALWQATVNVQQDTFDERMTANGSIAYQGNRGEIGITQISGVSSGGNRAFNPDLADQRTLLRAGTSIAFADGHVAIGRPIRSGAFAIAYPHETLADNEITAGTDDNVVARSDMLGPALITGIPTYVPSSIPVSAADLPIGYSLGSSTLDTLAPYKAGYSFQVGSGNSVSAFGTLTRATGEPISLQTGVAHPEGQTTPSVPVFTNGAGRFGAEGLAPGRWVIDLNDDDATARYAFVVPEKTQGLFKAGILTPEQTR